MNQARRGTQRDIAKAANVSQTLVSRVLSGADIEVGEETRLRILAEAQKLGYAPRRRSPSVKRKKLLAYIQPIVRRGDHKEEWIYRTYEEFFQRVHTELLKAAHEAGYALIARPHTDAAELMEWLTEWEVDGVFWHSRDDVLLRWITERYPTVQINRHDFIKADAASSNQEEIIILAMDYLRSMGHTRIGFLPMSPSDDRLWMMRSRAYSDYVERYNLPSCAAIQTIVGFEDAKVKSFFEKLQSEPEKHPTALILSDHTALRMMKLATECRFDLSAHLSLIGVDNVSACSHTVPPLTSVDPCMDELARVAVVTLLERISNPSVNARKVLVSPELIIRKSVADLRNTATPTDASTSLGQLQHQ